MLNQFLLKKKIQNIKHIHQYWKYAAVTVNFSNMKNCRRCGAQLVYMDRAGRTR